MRQFVFGLLCAALAWWGYSSWTADKPERTPEPSNPIVAEGLLRSHAGSPPVAQDQGTAGAAEQPAPDAQAPAPQADPAAAAAPADAAWLDGVRAGQPAALDAAWRRLASGASAGEQTSLLEALGENRVDDVGKVLAALGTGNAFLHSAAGRAVADRAVALAAALTPEAAARALTRLLELSMRGPIQRTDVDARAFVDRTAKDLRKNVERFLCDPANVARSRSHTVAPGETLYDIAKAFAKEDLRVRPGTLMALNRIHNAKTIRPGQHIKCPLDPIKTVIEKRSFLMAVYVGDLILRVYWVGHGADDKTPVTEFKVTEILENPDWYAPDGRLLAAGNPDNILGKYFVRLSHDAYQGFGIHGTTQPETIGTMASMGCIRMLDGDIEEFANLVPRGTVVEVRDSK